MTVTSPHPSCASRQRPTRRKQARPGELLAAALDLFVEKGYAATRVEEVARRAGVSKGTLFLYFASKDELFKAVVRENISGRFAHWRGEIEAFTGSSAELLRHAMQVWWSQVGDTKASGISKLIMSEASNFPELAVFYNHEVIEPGNQLILRILQRGVARGEFRPMDLHCGVHMVMAPMLYLLLWKHSLAQCIPRDPPWEPQDYLAAQIDTLLNGLLVAPASVVSTDRTPAGATDRPSAGAGAGPHVRRAHQAAPERGMPTP